MTTITLDEIRARHDLATINGVGNATADYLEAFGHCQDGAYTGKRWPFVEQPAACVLEAWSRVEPQVNGTLRAICEAIDDRPALFSVVDWSDTTPTEEVIATLRGLGAEEATA